MPKDTKLAIDRYMYKYKELFRDHVYLRKYHKQLILMVLSATF